MSRSPTDKSEAAKIAFREVAKEVFEKKITPHRRAQLRDRLANAVLPDWLQAALNRGSEQLDGTEFLNFLLDAIVPEESKLISTEETASGNNRNQQQSCSSKIDIPIAQQIGVIPKKDVNLKFSEMLATYSAQESLTGKNQVKNSEGRSVDATKSIRLSVRNHDSDIVLSLGRFSSALTGETLTRDDGTTYPKAKMRKIRNNVTIDSIKLADSNGNERHYEATSFMLHRGSLQSGHYATYVKELVAQDGTEKAIWVCYNDSSRIELGENLPQEASQAYTIKFSPLADDYQKKTGRERYLTGLPKSQKCGTRNGGSRCWANAAFAFALSITSLYQQEVAHEADETNEEEEKGKSFKEIVEEVAKGSNSVSNSDFSNAAQTYLLDLCSKLSSDSDEEFDRILGLHSFFADKGNVNSVLSLISQISEHESKFFSNPLAFIQKLLPDSTSELEEPLKSITTEDLIFAAIAKEDTANLKEMLHCASKRNKDILTDALCHAITDDKQTVVDFLQNECGANLEQKSKIYGCTANEILAQKKPTTPHPTPIPTSAKSLKNIHIFKIPADQQSIWHKTKRAHNYGLLHDDETNVNKKMASILLSLMTDKEVCSKNGDQTLQKEQLLDIIEFARRNSGGVNYKKTNTEAVGSSYEKQTYKNIKEFFDERESDVSPSLAKLVSKKYQDKCKEAGIFSGRETSKKQVGLRLTFLPDGALDIFKKLTSEADTLSCTFDQSR